MFCMGEGHLSTTGTTVCEGAATSETQQENYHLAHSSCVEHVFVLSFVAYITVCVILLMLTPQCRAFPLVYIIVWLYW